MWPCNLRLKPPSSADDSIRTSQRTCHKSPRLTAHRGKPPASPWPWCTRLPTGCHAPASPAWLASDARAWHDPYRGAFGFVGEDSHWAGSELTRAHPSEMPYDLPEPMARRGPGWRKGCIQRWNRGLDADELAHLDEIGLAGDLQTAATFAGNNATECARWVPAGEDEPDFGAYLDRNLGPAGIADCVRAGVDLEQVRTAYDRSVELGQSRT